LILQESNNVIDEYKNIHKPNAPAGVEVVLGPGDMLIYAGCELEHWRNHLKATFVVKYFCIIIIEMVALQKAICMIKDLYWVFLRPLKS
jgi:hypothetical protein